ncbi:MAG: CBS domain-containing protein [Candidatus Cloacimonetes bacterium]|nr:CBS domain-containing protein [Candidatus Cloacimonadota bacterium]
MGAMHLSSLVDLSLVFLNSTLNDLKEIFTFIVNQKNKKYPSNVSVDDLVSRLMNRKLDEGVLLPSGVAIPHLHLDDFKDTTISVLKPKKPIETQYGTIKIFFMVFTCKSDNALYMKILQSIIKMSKDQVFFEKLMKSKTPYSFRKTLKECDLAVKNAINVSDIMNTKTYAVTDETSLKELSQLFYEHNFGYFLVNDAAGNLIGEVTIRDYVMSAFPAYTQFIGNLNFLKTLDPFERLIKDEDNFKVKDVMKPIEIAIKPDSTIFEAAFLMNKNNRRDLPVMENGKLVGIISFMDIFRKVIKG